MPSVRKHGLYAVDELLENPDFYAAKRGTDKKKEAENKQKQLEILDIILELYGLVRNWN